MNYKNVILGMFSILHVVCLVASGQMKAPRAFLSINDSRDEFVDHNGLSESERRNTNSLELRSMTESDHRASSTVIIVNHADPDGTPMFVVSVSGSSPDTSKKPSMSESLPTSPTVPYDSSSQLAASDSFIAQQMRILKPVAVETETVQNPLGGGTAHTEWMYDLAGRNAWQQSDNVANKKNNLSLPTSAVSS